MHYEIVPISPRKLQGNRRKHRFLKRYQRYVEIHVLLALLLVWGFVSFSYWPHFVRQMFLLIYSTNTLPAYYRVTNDSGRKDA